MVGSGPLRAIFFYKVYISLRWESKREFRITVSVCNSEIAERNDIHSYQYIGTMGDNTLNDANIYTLNAIWQLDVDQKRSYSILASNMVRVCKSRVNQSTSIDDRLCNHTVRGARIPNSRELSGSLVVLYTGRGDFTSCYQNLLDTVKGGSEAKGTWLMNYENLTLE